MLSHQEKSEIYWKSATNSHLAPPEFYENKKKIVSAILAHLPNSKAALDIGCGNGEYTVLLLPKTEKIVAYDLSPALLDEARHNYGHEEKISFHLASIDDIAEDDGSFDIAFCMGVTSCIIDDDKYTQLIKKMVRLTSGNSFIITGDTVSHGQNLLMEYASGYVAKYRDVNLYKKTMEAEGLTLVKEIKLMDSHGGKTANVLFLFWKP